MTPPDEPHVPPLEPNDYWIDAGQAAEWLADGVFELVSPLDEERPTSIELSEEQEGTVRVAHGARDSARAGDADVGDASSTRISGRWRYWPLKSMP